MTYDVPVQMTVSEGFGPIPAPSSSIMVVTYEETEPIYGSIAYRCVFDKTMQEVADAIQNGVTVLMKDKYNQHIAPVSFSGSAATAFFSYVQTINPPAYFENYVINKRVDMNYSSDPELINKGASIETRFPITQNVLVATATEQSSNGDNYVVLDKTFREILNAPCCIITFASDDGTFNSKWLVCEIHTSPQLTIVASAWFDGSLSPVTFQASSYDDYPRSV